MMKCSVCGKKEIKWITTDLGSYDYGFCSKVCIANNAIRHFELKKGDGYNR